MIWISFQLVPPKSANVMCGDVPWLTRGSPHISYRKSLEQDNFYTTEGGAVRVTVDPSQTCPSKSNGWGTLHTDSPKSQPPGLKAVGPNAFQHTHNDADVFSARVRTSSRTIHSQMKEVYKLECLCDLLFVTTSQACPRGSHETPPILAQRA